MANLTETLNAKLSAGLKRQSLTTCSRWAREYIHTPEGKLSFENHPWEVGMHDSNASVNVGQKAAQMGYSTAAMHRVFYYIDVHKVNCLYLLPTKTPDATDFSMTKFDPALESSPHLTSLFNKARNVGLKRAGANTLWIRGMNSRSALKSIDPSLIVLDELDEMPQEKIALAEIRTSGQKRLEYWKISTPTAPDFGIAKEMEDSTQEHFFFKCPCCDKRTELTFPDCLVVTADDLNDPKIKDSHLICAECKNRLPSHYEGGVDIAKSQWLSKAIWETTVQNPNWDKRGFYINQLYSMMWAARPEVLAQWVIRAKLDPSAEQELYNSRMGLAHVVDGAKITDEMINMAILKGGGYRKEALPPRSGFITMGVDIGKYIHFVIVAWQFGRMGPDLNMIAIPRVLFEGHVKEFNELDAYMQMYQPVMTVVDSEPETRAAFEFAVKWYGRVKLCKFTRGQTDSRITVSKQQENHYIRADKTSWVDASLGRFKTGRILLPADTSQEFRDHVKAPVKIYRESKDGNRTAFYLKTKPDHLAFALTYAEIALPIGASFTSNQDVEAFL